ncbi:response regulator [Prevotella dentasini]|uniref:response regulator n=1 Tax=Prevotella dentasini TaxID=589537 RepID=UPI001F35B7D0|nr:response regulator [Prevotella dentasini]
MLFTLSSMLSSCGEKQSASPAYTDAQRLQLDTTANHTKNVDSLMLFVIKYRKAGDRCREMAALAALGHGYQTASRYSDAVKAHQRQLDIAEQLDDTLMKASALNDIGVNYRRLGLHYDGLDYHLRAVETSLLYPDDEISEKMLKCRAIGYNGAGNVYLSIGNYGKADEMLRKALAVETRLGSHLGMNVDLSNLGIVYERRGMIDSAWVYYKESMRHSELANSYTGKAYGYMNYGRLYALRGDYGKAIEEYRRSMALVHTDRDLWLWMQPAIALAEAYVNARMPDSARLQLDRAQKTAKSISAREYLPKIDRIRAKLCEQQGDYQQALVLNRKAVAQEDSLLNARNLFEIETLQSNIADRHRAKLETERREELLRERWIGRIALFGLLITSILLALLLYIQRMRRRNHLALKQMSVLRENFFTNITHEFRTPLTVILGLSHDLQVNATEEVRDKMKTIERQGKGLLALINQLLDISKIKSSAGNPDWRNGNITMHIKMIVETYRDYARNRNIDLNFIGKEAVEMDFVPDYVNKVLNNLLSNAFKFTSEYGEISISVWSENGQLRIDVADTGEGMDKETVSHVFEPFYQAESKAKSIGTGVGMALVKQIMDAVSGQIAVESEIGKGTTFHISVPIKLNKNGSKVIIQDYDATAENTPLLLESEAVLADSEGEDNLCRLLIIEDNSDIAAYIGSQFADDYAVSYAINGREGLEKAQELVPDLIITDWMMPGMDGLEVCRQIRSNDIINHIPIIVVTAKITEEDRIRGIEAGADAYLAKPFNADELRMRVEKLLDNRRILREKFAQELMEQKESTIEETDQPDESDLRFLSKLSATIYMQIRKNKDVDVSLVASDMCMSSRQLHRKLVALTGCTPVAYIQRVKIRKAKKLLDDNPQMSFNEVADLCGFDFYSSFVRAFRNVCGITPTEYRKREK